MNKKTAKKRTMYGLMAASAAASALGAVAVPFAAPVLRNAGDIMVNNGTVDMASGGNATITIKGNDGQSMVGKRFEVFQLFNAVNSKNGESINYTFNAKYADSLKKVVANELTQSTGSQVQPADVNEYMVIDYIQSLNTNKVEGAQAAQKVEGRYSKFRKFVDTLRDQIKEDGIEGDIIYVNSTKPDNSITLEHLKYGYYVVDEISTHGEGGEDDQWYASSLCMVNTANPNASINIKSDYPEIIKKIMEDDHKDVIGNDGWNDVADYEIGQKVPYKFESTISDMNGYDTYYYAIHDQMDQELTLNKDKKAISIEIQKGSKTYKLKDTEYSVITDPAQMDAGDTFMFEVADIKKIIDREFNNIDKLGHNDYSGITVTWKYEAILNDKAADKTGRPGFENDVRLEFSNDSDSDGRGDTGYTPWDTVVCFTFKINGLKVNDHETILDGASFRLYSDKDCKNEVFVKAKPEGGYIVINRDSAGGTDHTGGTAPAEAVEMVSNENGNFIIHGLDQGTYYLKETKAPDGYRVLADAIVVTVEPTYTTDRNDYVAGEGATDATLQELTATATIKSFYDGAFKTDTVNLTTDVEDGSADIKVVNKVGSKLPITGSSMMLIVLGSGLAMVGGATAIKRKKSEE